MSIGDRHSYLFRIYSLKESESCVRLCSYRILSPERKHVWIIKEEIGLNDL